MYGVGISNQSQHIILIIHFVGSIIVQTKNVVCIAFICYKFLQSFHKGGARD